jgi:phytoene dehydrogenase-like protein
MKPPTTRLPFAERVLDILETYAPGLWAKILGRSVWSPLDLERENPCLMPGRAGA